VVASSLQVLANDQLFSIDITPKMLLMLMMVYSKLFSNKLNFHSLNSVGSIAEALLIIKKYEYKSY
jgi:hypothetical protein